MCVKKRVGTKKKLPVLKLILMVTAPCLSFNTDVLTTHFYAMSAKKSRRHQHTESKAKQSIDCFFYFMKFAFAIVNIFRPFSHLFISISICTHTDRLPNPVCVFTRSLSDTRRFSSPFK